jgi:ech hydrogenase subunit F
MFKMTSNIVRNLVVKKSTRMYPAEVREPFAKIRGELVNDIERCIFCGTCEVKCPSQCIQVDKKAYTWTYDPFACVFCGVCVDTCPAKSLYHKTQYRSPIGERLIISLQGQPRKKEKTKDRESAKEGEKDPVEEKPTPDSTPSA